MADSVGMNLKLDGEAEYRQSLTNIVAQTKTLDSEMKALQSSFDDSTDSLKDHEKVLEKAKDKSKLLEKQVELLKDKVEESAEATGENSTETERWKKKLADAETQLNKTNKQIEEEQDAIEDLQSPLGELNDLIEDQTAQLDDLKEAYANAWLSGDADRCDELADSISQLSGELEANQAALDEATGAADGLTGGLESATGASSVLGTVMPASFSTIAGAAMTADIGGIISGIGDAIVGTLEKVDEMVVEWQGACDSLVIATGASGDALADMNEQMEAAYTNSRALGGSIGDTAAIEGQVATLYRVSGEELGNLTQKIDEFSYAMGVDGVQATTQLYNITKTWEAEGYTTADIMDRITYGAQASGVSTTDYMNALDKCHVSMSELGMSLDEGIDFLNRYALAGGDVSKAQRALKTASDNMANSGYDANIMFNKAIEIAGQYTNVTDAMNASIGDTGLTIKDVFGDGPAAKDMIDTLTNGKLAIDDIGTAAENAPGAFEAMMEGITSAYDEDKKAMENFGTDMKRQVSETVDAQSALRKQIAAALTGNKADFDKWTQYIDQNFNKVKSSGNVVKDFFANMKIQFPSIKLPHFSITGTFSLNPPSVPHLKVDWYKKAYDQAMILNSPTIFGASGGSLLGGGDGAGAEVVVGETHLLGMMTRAVQAAFGYAPGGNTTNNYGGASVNVNVYGAPGQDVRELARLVSREIDRSVKVRSM